MAQDLRLNRTFAATLPEQTLARAGRIGQLDLERQKRAAITDGADAALVQRAELPLRRFLALPLLFPEDGPFTPTVPVDLLWHELVLESVKYHGFCQDVYGAYLHHVPEDERTPPTARTPRFVATLDKLRRAFDDIDEQIWTPGPLVCNTCMAVLWRDVSPWPQS